MTYKYTFNRDTHEVTPADDLIEWATWFETVDRYVARTEVGPYHVCTIFLGLDHNFGIGPPLLFETMVWIDDGSRYHKWLDEQERCSTWDEAVAQHEHMCARIAERVVAEKTGENNDDTKPVA